MGEARSIQQTCKYVHCKKRLAVFPSPAGMSLTKLSLAGNNLIIPGQTEFVRDIPTGDRKTANLFLQCTLTDIHNPVNLLQGIFNSPYISSQIHSLPMWVVHNQHGCFLQSHSRPTGIKPDQCTALYVCFHSYIVLYIQ